MSSGKKIGIDHFVELISKKHDLSKKDAEDFVESMFLTLVEGLDKDKHVKIKGFGTFKVLSVGARRSVDVNTGQNITIEERERLSFTPDTAMKDAVNKPFSQFETVILNDGVEFDGTTSNIPIESSIKEETIQKKEETEKRVQKKEIELENKVENKDAVEEQIIEQQTIDELQTIKNRVKLLLVFIVFLIALIGGGVYYMYNIMKDHDIRVVQLETKLYKRILPNKENNNKGNNVEKKDTTIIKSYSGKEINSKILLRNKNKEEKSSEVNISYNDPRVRTGAYRIVGIEREIKAKTGQTLRSISVSIFGQGMECYMEAVNGGNIEIKEGQVIKVPKLELKKRR